MKTNLSFSEAGLPGSPGRAESVLSASVMMWLVVNRRLMSMALFPESEELLTFHHQHHWYLK